MDWQKMSRRQQDAARQISTEYNVSVSQAAKHFDTAMACRNGEITRARLAEITGWKVQPSADDLLAERDALLAKVTEIEAQLAVMGVPR